MLGPYRDTHAETVDNLTQLGARLSHADGPLLAIEDVAAAVEHGSRKHAKGDWRTKDQRWFLAKTLRHLRQHYGLQAFEDGMKASAIVAQHEPEYIDVESGVPHLAKAATNILMALENCSNVELDEEPITAEELGMTYLAMPYTKSPHTSCRVASEISSQCAKDGIHVYAPTLYGHIVASEGSYDYWISHGLKLLSACDSITFVQHKELGSWTLSKGCQLEATAAREAGLRMYEFDYETKKTRRL
jgi:hypothetical protein